MAAFLSIPGLRNYFLPKILYSINFLFPPIRLKIYVNNLRFKAKSTLKKKHKCIQNKTPLRFKPNASTF